MTLSDIYKKQKNIVIGALHLPPLPGYEGFPGFDCAIENAIKDAAALQAGGADGIIFENNYDVPHAMEVSGEVVDAMIRIGAEIKSQVSIPLGVSVLWNDYKAALTIAKKLDLRFVRVPVFVDKVKTAYGPVEGNPMDVLAFRASIGAHNVALYTDIQVKHAEILTNELIEETARRAIEAGSDALIVTGRWTGDAPQMDDLERVRDAVGDFPILCGSGVDADNAPGLFAYANGAIVSTALKVDAVDIHEANIKPYEARISQDKVSRLVRAIR